MRSHAANVSISASPLSRTRPSALLTWTALLIVYVVWGSTYYAIRVVTASLPVFGSAAARFAVAGAMLAAILVVVNGAGSSGFASLKVTWRQLGACALIGMFLVTGGNGFVILSESPSFALPSGITALLIALNPLFMVALQAGTGDRPSPLTVLGVLIGLGGLAALFLPGSARAAVPIAGAGLMLLSVLCWGVGSFATRYLPMPASPFVASAYQMISGSAAMALIAAGRDEPAIWSARMPDGSAVPADAWIALAYLTAIGSVVGFTAYIWLLQHVSISLATTYAYVNPIIALVLGAVAAGEVLNGQIVLAAGLVLAGVALVVSTERRP